jgi:hypothetical protein
MNLKRRLRAIEQPPERPSHRIDVDGKQREAIAYLAERPDLDLCVREDFAPGWEGGQAWLFLLVLRFRAKGDHANAAKCTNFQRKRQSMDDAGPEVPLARIAELLDAAAKVARARTNAGSPPPP